MSSLTALLISWPRAYEYADQLRDQGWHVTFDAETGYLYGSRSIDPDLGYSQMWFVATILRLTLSAKEWADLQTEEFERAMKQRMTNE